MRAATIHIQEIGERILSEALADSRRVDNWLRHQRHPECKRQFQLCEQRYGEARISYLAAKSRAPKMGRPMIESEEKAYKKAKYALQEAEHTFKMVQKSILELPGLVEHSAHHIYIARQQLRELGPAALNSLDRMIENVHNYLEQTRPKQMNPLE